MFTSPLVETSCTWDHPDDLILTYLLRGPIISITEVFVAGGGGKLAFSLKGTPESSNSQVPQANKAKDKNKSKQKIEKQKTLNPKVGILHLKTSPK